MSKKFKLVVIVVALVITTVYVLGALAQLGVLR